MNKNPTRYQQAQEVLRINNLREAHEYYQENPGCTMKQAMTFTSLPDNIIKMYSAIRTECLTVITAVIDMRYDRRGAQDEKEV